MGIFSKLFGGNHDEQAQPKNEIIGDETVVLSEEERLQADQEYCPNCWFGHTCHIHMDWLEQIVNDQEYQ